MSVSKSFTAVGVSNAMRLPPGQSVDYALSGTFAATIVLEQGQPGMFWNSVTSGTAPYSSNLKNSSGQSIWVRFRCAAYTSGTAVTSLTEADDAVLEVTDQSGNVVATITDSGFGVTEVSAPDGEILFGNSGGDGVTSDAGLTFAPTNPGAMSTLIVNPIATDETGALYNFAVNVNSGVDADADTAGFTALNASAYASAGATVDGLTGISADVYADENTTITNQIGLGISVYGEATSEVTTAYGLKIDAIEIGETNYAIKTGAGLNDLGDDLSVTGDIVASGDVKAATYHVGATAGQDATVVITGVGTLTFVKGIMTDFTEEA